MSLTETPNVAGKRQGRDADAVGSFSAHLIVPPGKSPQVRELLTSGTLRTREGSPALPSNPRHERRRERELRLRVGTGSGFGSARSSRSGFGSRSSATSRRACRTLKPSTAAMVAGDSPRSTAATRARRASRSALGFPATRRLSGQSARDTTTAAAMRDFGPAVDVLPPQRRPRRRPWASASSLSRSSTSRATYGYLVPSPRRASGMASLAGASTSGRCVAALVVALREDAGEPLLAA